MAQGQLGLYRQCPAEVQPAALCVKARVLTWRSLSRTVQEPDGGHAAARGVYADDIYADGQ